MLSTHRDWGISFSLILQFLSVRSRHLAQSSSRGSDQHLISPPHVFPVADILAFAIIVISAKKTCYPRYPGIPRLMDAILRDGTIYFLLTCLLQILADLFIIFAPVGVKFDLERWSVILYLLCLPRVHSSSSPGCKFTLHSMSKRPFGG